MPPPCHRANTPGACGAAEINDSVNGTLRLVMDMLLPARSKCILRLQFACRPRCATYVAAFRQAGNGTAFSRLPRRRNWAQRLQKHGHQEPGRKRGDHAVEAEWCFMPGARADH